MYQDFIESFDDDSLTNSLNRTQKIHDEFRGIFITRSFPYTGCPEIHLSKRRCSFLTKSNHPFLNGREMIKVFYWFQINNMSHSLETKIQVIVLTAKYESPVIVICQLQFLYITEVVKKHSCLT